MTHAVGIDIGGTGIKGAVVDVKSGELVLERIKVATPEGGEPEAIVSTVVELIERFGELDKKTPVGVCFPAAVVNGITLSAANVSNRWIGLKAEKLFEKALGRDIHFINDADAAGVAEQRYGAARHVKGLAILTTLGTGIGTALIHRGHLVPNAELGHLEIEGVDWETRAAYSAKEREDLSWEAWAARLQTYYERLEVYLYPELFIVGGGVSKHADKFLHLLDLSTPIVPAVMRNNAGILGAAVLAADR